MSGDSLGWAAAGFAAALVHGALAYAATLMPVATPPPQVEIEIEMLDLGGGLALQPSPVEAVMSGIAPQVMQQAAVEARQQPVASQSAAVAAQTATAVPQVALAAATTQAATTAAIAPTVSPSPTSVAPQAATVQPIGAAAPITVHVTAPSASPVGAQTATPAQPAPAVQQGVGATGRSTIAPGSGLANATAPLPAAASVNSVVPAATAATAAPTAFASVQGMPAVTSTAAAATPAVGPVAATEISPATTTPAATPVASVAPVTAQPASTAAPRLPTSESGAPAQPETVANLPEAVGLPVPTRTDLVELITDFSGSECFSASPVSTDEGGFSVESLAIASDDNDRLREAVLEAFGDQVSFQGSTITPEQCRALGFLGGSAGSVGETVRLGVDTRTIASGSTLTGILEGTADRVVHLLIVDDDGNIQAANAYTESVGPDTRFEIPLVVTGAGSARAQILFSVVVDEMMQTAAEAVDVPADKFFDALEFELIVKGLDADLSVASFTVE